MGFRDKLKNVFKANKQEKQMSVDNVSDVSKQENKDTETTLNNRFEVKPVVHYKLKKPNFDVDSEISGEIVPNYEIKSLSDLEDAIHRGAKKIVLGTNIISDSSVGDYFGIDIDVDELIIDGNNHVIDACGKTRFFNIKGGNITIKNITFKNGYSKSGGAISASGGCELNIVNCIFKSNIAHEWGGAINNYDGNLNLINCTFSKNSANFGGAINNYKGILIIIDSNFESNTANYGGTIRNRNIMEIQGCKLLKNSSSNNIICNHNYLTINNTIFEDNDSTNGIYNESNDLVKLKSNLNIITGKFLNNKFIESVIYNNGVSCEIHNSFLEKDSSKLLIHSNSKMLLNNSITKGNGKTILNNGEFHLKDVDVNLKNHIIGLGKIKYEKTSNQNHYDFNYLDTLIHKSEKNKIILNEDISIREYESYDYEDGIKLDVDNLVIDGNGCIIDAGNISRIFKVTGSNITLKNIKFKNGNSKENGGAILNHNDLKIIDCSFDLNGANYGGAIYNKGKLTISNSNFENNSAEGHGGTINNDIESICFVEASIFNSNKAGSKGGVIYNSGDLTIDNCNVSKNLSSPIFNSSKLLINNSVIKENNGKAISNHSEAIVKYTVFSKNGQSIFNKGDLCINSCDFKFNQFIVINNSSSLKINNCNIDSNSGEVLFNEGNLNIFQSSMSNNTSNSDLLINEGDLSICECHMLNNNSKNHKILENKKNLVITDSIFQNNCAKSELISCANDSILKITNSSIINNIIKESGTIIDNHGFINIRESIINENNIEGEGGLILNLKNMKVFDSQLNDNYTREYIIKNLDSFQFQNIRFENNNSKHLLINDNLKDSNVESNLSLFNGKFRNNNLSGSLIYNNAKSCTISDSVFDNNISNGLIKKTYNIYNLSNLTLIKINIKDDGKSILNEGTIYIKNEDFNVIDKIKGSGEICSNAIPKEERFDFSFLDKKIHENNGNELILSENISFENYERDFYEGGIDLDIDNLIIDGKGKIIDGKNITRIFHITGKNITLKNIIFKNGYCHKNYDNPFNGDGAALVTTSKSKLKLINCKFINCNSEQCGGSIKNNGNLELSNSILENNAAKFNGGVIYNCGDLTLNNCMLQSNQANNAGAILNIKNLDIKDSTVNNNHANEDGGAIINYGELNIVESKLNDNTAINGGVILNKSFISIEASKLNNNSAESGGVIFNDNGSINLSASSMIENTAEKFAGVIYNHQGKVSLIYCTSESNKSINTPYSLGGVIYNEGFLQISASVFNKNEAASWGGAIYNKNSYLSINAACSFSNNRASNGGAIYNDNGSLHLMNSDFKSNSANDGGAILSLRKKDVRVRSCSFENNNPNDSAYEDN